MEPHTQNSETDLWMILAVIQPFKLDAVTLALEAVPGFGGMTVSECRGFGQRTNEMERETEPSPRRRRDDADLLDFTNKVKLEIGVRGRARADAIIEAIVRAAHTGNRGDGKVLAWPLVRAVRVRTFDRDAKAL